MTAVPDVAVVTICRGRRAHLARQRRSLREHSPGTRHVVIDMGGDPIDDDEGLEVVPLDVPPGTPLPLATARNLGAEVASDAGVLIFLDVDCVVGAHLVTGYRDLVGEFGGVWSGPVGYLPPSSEIESWDERTLHRSATFHDGRPRPGQAPEHGSWQMFWSLSFAVDPRTWTHIGGFDEGYVGYGGEDTDFARTALGAGEEFWFDGDATAFHQHHPVSSPPVEHVDDIVSNARRFHDKWGDWPMEGWLAAFVDLGLIEWESERGAIRRR